MPTPGPARDDYRIDNLLPRHLAESLQQTARLVTQSLRPHIEQLTAGVRAAIQPLTEHVQKILKEHELNIQTGWWYPNYIVDDLPDAIVHQALVNEEATKAFTKLVVKQCNRSDYARLRAMHDRWQNYAFLKPSRKKILADIITAHMRGQYTLSIPVAMIQIDYFHHAIFPSQDELPVEHTSRDAIQSAQQANFARHFGKDDYKRVPASVYFELYPVYHYFKNILYASEKLRQFQKQHNPAMYKLSDPNNRGAILHGDNIRYSSEARSLKQILLLDKILYMTNKLHTDRAK
jgi:hypothetical protein